MTRHHQGIVIHDGRKHIVHTSLNRFLQSIALSYLSTLQGRKLASRALLKEHYLLPVFLHETILLFPTHAHRHMDNHYINYHQVLRISKSQNGSSVEFVDGTKIHLNKDVKWLYKQLDKAHRLWEYYECAKQKESVYIGVFPLDFSV